MENSNNQLDIINYLYGEMNADEKSIFEEKMANDSALREEVKAMMKTRKALGQLPDKEVMEPPIAYTSLFREQTRGQWPWIKPLMAVAATIVILLLTGYFTQFSIRYSNDDLFIGFAGSAVEQYPDRSEVKDMINEAANSQQAAFEQELLQTKDSLQKFYVIMAQQDLRQGKTNEPLPPRVVSETELRKQLTDWQSTNRALLQQYFTTVNEQQQEYLKEALVQFSDYLQQQREEDLLMIQQNLIDLKDYQDHQKRQTNQVLAGLIKTVSQQK